LTRSGQWDCDVSRSVGQVMHQEFKLTSRRWDCDGKPARVAAGAGLVGIDQVGMVGLRRIAGGLGESHGILGLELTRLGWWDAT